MESNQCLRDRLVQIEAQITLLTAERKTIQQKIQSITYPVLSLPFEVISDIFIQCLPDLQHADPIFKFSPQKLPIPLLLSQICKAWKDVVLDTPKLWAIFRICVEFWPTDHGLGSRRLAKWVERAGSSPLSFVLERIQPHFDTPKSPSQILGPILALSTRWQTVGLRLPRRDLITDQFRSGLHGKLPTLEELHISPVGSDETVITAFELAPSLRSVFLRGLSPTLILLPWNQLTHFSGEWLNAKACSYILRLAVSLIECKLTGLGRGSMDEEAELNLLPPHLALKVLHLKASSEVLFTLALPSLVELDYEDGDISQYHQRFISFLSRSRPPLVRLFLHGGAYQRVLHGSSFLLGLTVLEISDLDPAGMSDLLNNLRVDPAAFLPNLESLALSVWEMFNSTEETSKVDYGNLVDALELRWQRNGLGSGLKSFRMQWGADEWSDNSLDDHPNKFISTLPATFRLSLPRFQKLLEEGMHISVTAQTGKMSQIWI
ncbi:hypothetical protein K438DRAFT_1944552 [Mycena galopus ATCC 62051]|nr:hypothetical protein K438DRAFT_1944552 [Mycena galopus ATCC 62051]